MILRDVISTDESRLTSNEIDNIPSIGIEIICISNLMEISSTICLRWHCAFKSQLRTALDPQFRTYPVARFLILTQLYFFFEKINCIGQKLTLSKSLGKRLSQLWERSVISDLFVFLRKLLF